MSQSNTLTTAFMLASGAAVGALITYVGMKSVDNHNRKSSRKDASDKNVPFFRTTSSKDSIEVENLDEHFHLQDTNFNENKRIYHRESSHRLPEAVEKRDRLPALIILVRHGESQGNADHTLYRTKPDNLVELTEKGIEQAREAGKRIEEIFLRYDNEEQPFKNQPSRLDSEDDDDDDDDVSSLGLDEVTNENDDVPENNNNDKSYSSLHSMATTATTSSLQPAIKRVHLVISPFERTLQTAAALRTGFEHRIVRTDVQARIREQEFGNLQGDDFQHFREEQKRVGRFWYRFPTGESGSDVSDRVQSWWHDSVLNVNERVGYAPIDALVVVTHGLTMRFVLMQLYGWSPTTFHSVWNADNCDTYVLKKDLSKPGLSPYILDETLGGNMPRSSIEVMVEFHNSDAEEIVGEELKNEESNQSGQSQNQKKFKLLDYLSIPPPRTTQLELVKKKLVEQYPEEIGSVDRIKSIIFMPFIHGPLTQGRSTSGLLRPQEDEEIMRGGLTRFPEREVRATEGTKLAISNMKRRRRRRTKNNKKKQESNTPFPYYAEVQNDSWRPRHNNGEHVIAERNYR